MALFSTKRLMVRFSRHDFFNHRANVFSRCVKFTETQNSVASDSCSRRKTGACSGAGSEDRLYSTFTSGSRQRWTTLGTVLGALAFVAGCVAYLKRKSTSLANIQTPFSPVLAAINNWDLPASKRFNFIADVVDIAAPAVVFIEIKDRHPFSGRFFTVSNGSGFIVRADGLVITNAHVVANKSIVRVRLFDGKELEGWVIAVDPVSDLAAIKIDAKGLPVLKMGQSSKLRAGEWVVAMGSPLSLSNTVTCGIVSSVNRGSKELGLRNKDMDYIQTDALINFGNSGGPLVNLDGEVIGINTMKVTPGISFAIPSDYASNFLNKVHQILEKGHPKQRKWLNMGVDAVRRRFIGITMLTLNLNLIMDLKARVPEFPDIIGGVLVHKIIVGSPAYTGGVRAGDIIVEINGKSIQSASDVYNLVEASESLAIVAYRGLHKMDFVVASEEIH